MTAALDDVPLLYLLVELLKGGKASVFRQLRPLERIDLDEVVAALQRRTGINLGKDFNSWYSWFMKEYSGASEEDRETLRLAKEMVETTDFYAQRFNKKRGEPST
jgi:hypothetical protein